MTAASRLRAPRSTRFSSVVISRCCSFGLTNTTTVAWARLIPRRRGVAPRALRRQAGGVLMLQHVRAFGPSPRLAAFLLSLLKPASQNRYVAALQTFQDWLRSLSLEFGELSEESQDFLLCDYVLDCMGREFSPQHCTDLVAAIQKQYAGRRRYRAATLTIEGWRSNSPVNMADPMPEEVCYAMVSIVFAANRKVVAMVILLCFVGFLRTYR